MGFLKYEEDEHSDETVERILIEIDNGEHARELEEHLVKKTDFFNDVIHAVREIDDDKKLGEFVRQELSVIIGEFAEVFHG